MTFPAPSGSPVVADTEPPKPKNCYMIGDWECRVYLHPTKRNSVQFTAKHVTRKVGINVVLMADQLATFDPDKFWNETVRGMGVKS